MARPRRGSRPGLDQRTIEIQGSKRDCNRRHAHRSQSLDHGPRAGDFSPSWAASRSSGSRAGPGLAGIAVAVAHLRKALGDRRRFKRTRSHCNTHYVDPLPEERVWVERRTRLHSMARPDGLKIWIGLTDERDPRLQARLESTSCHRSRSLDCWPLAGDLRPARAASRRRGSRAGRAKLGSQSHSHSPTSERHSESAYAPKAQGAIPQGKRVLTQAREPLQGCR